MAPPATAYVSPDELSEPTYCNAELESILLKFCTFIQPILDDLKAKYPDEDIPSAMDMSALFYLQDCIFTD